MPPPVTSATEPLASRLFLGPALRAQSDTRLVKLVREGYEGAFEEIVRRYRKPLDRFAASFVGARSEDVTQDAFSKALLALRGSENEIELRPWLYRIVRNTALNDIRDRPPTVEQLEETLAGSESAAVEAERREEMTELMTRLRALPEPQRAAIVMRELEGLSHDEIAAALGVSGGAARQAIYRARISLRNGLGLLVPLPILRMLFEHGAAADAATGAAAAAGVAGAGAAAAGGGATLGGIGAGTALKAGLATVLVAGAVGAGVAVENQRSSGGGGPERAEAAVSAPASGGARSGASGDGLRESGGSGSGTSGEREPGDDRGGRGDDRDDDRGSDENEDRGDNSGLDGGDDRHGGDPGRGSDDDSSGHGGRGTSGHRAPDDDDDHSGSGHSGSGGSGSSHPEVDDSDDGSHSGPGGGEDDGSHSGPGSGDSGGSIVPPPPPPPEEVSGGDDESSGSGSGESDEGSRGSGSGGDDG